MSESDLPPPWSRRKKWKVGFIVAACVLGGTIVWFRVSYPYGPSHCCATELGGNLQRYAMDHDGWFPRGARSPEGSFSLLNPTYEPNLQRLRGKMVPLPIAEKAWQQLGQLDPDSCGWHYVEGLSVTNDPTIAIAWDKSWGLGHNGQRIRKFGREVIFLDGSTKPELLPNWPQFAADQRRKVADAIAGRTNGAPSIRWSDEETLGTNWFPKVKTN